MSNIEDLIKKVNLIASQFEKDGLIRDFLNGIKDQKTKIDSLVFVIEKKCSIEKVNALPTANIFFKECKIDQKYMPYFCDKLYSSAQDEPARIRFIRTCLWNKFLNDKSVFKEVISGFSAENFEKILDPVDMHSSVLKLSDEERSEIREYRALKKGNSFVEFPDFKGSKLSSAQKITKSVENYMTDSAKIYAFAA